MLKRLKFIKIIFTLLVVFFFNLAHSQTNFKGKLLNDQNNIIAGVFIQNLSTKQTTISNQYGLFELKSNINDTITFTALGYFSYIFICDSSNINSFQLIELKLKTDVLSTIEVSNKKIKDVINNQNETIIDFVFWNNNIVYLSKVKSKYFMGLSTDFKELNRFEIHLNKPKSLFIDSESNLYVSSKDSSYQVFIDTNLIIIDKMSLNDLNIMIKPIKDINEKFIISDNFINHNKNYKLVLFDRKTKKSSNIYDSYDELAAKTAQSKYSEIIYTYNKITAPTANIITNKLWSGDITELGHLSDSISQMIIWYSEIMAKPLNITTLKYDNTILVFDFYKKIIKAFNLYGTELYSISMKNMNNEYNSVLLDKFTEQFYIISPFKSYFKIDLINVFTGEITSKFIFKKITQPKNIKIYNGWVYFLSNNNDYYKLYKIKL